jgi:hypothetical protein
MLTEPVAARLDQESMTCRLQEAFPNATCALPAQMTRVIALMATATLEFPEA